VEIPRKRKMKLLRFVEEKGEEKGMP